MIYVLLLAVTVASMLTLAFLAAREATRRWRSLRAEWETTQGWACQTGHPNDKYTRHCRTCGASRPKENTT